VSHSFPLKNFGTRTENPTCGSRSGQDRGVSSVLTEALVDVVTIYKGIRHVVENTIPQNHQFVNRLFVILGKKGVIIYNFFLF
jgi:hypothetical protein